MAWTTPVTAIDGVALTAAQWNASVRDNLNLSPAALATTAGYHFASNGTNVIAERAILGGAVDTSETTTNTAYVDLATAGPSVTLTTGTKALVWISCQLTNSGLGQSCATYAVSGATTQAGSDTVAIVTDPAAGGVSNRFGVADLCSLTPGSNVFAMKYRVLSGTGTFLRRRIQVMGL